MNYQPFEFKFKLREMLAVMEFELRWVFEMRWQGIGIFQSIERVPRCVIFEDVVG